MTLPPSPVVPAAYGEILTSFQRELGLTDRQLAELAGRKAGPKDQTMYRLRAGTGSVKSAVAVRDALRKMGKDVPPVPIAGSGAMAKPTPVDELMMFLRPAEGETSLPILKIWDLAQLLRPYADPATGGFSGLTALRHLLECREAFERAWRLEVMKRNAADDDITRMAAELAASARALRDKVKP